MGLTVERMDEDCSAEGPIKDEKARPVRRAVVRRFEIRRFRQCLGNVLTL